VKNQRVGGVGGEKSGHVLGQDEPALPPVEGHAKHENGDMGRPLLVDQRCLSIQREGAGNDAAKCGQPAAERVLAGSEGEQVAPEW